MPSSAGGQSMTNTRHGQTAGRVIKRVRAVAAVDRTRGRAARLEGEDVAARATGQVLHLVKGQGGVERPLAKGIQYPGVGSIGPDEGIRPTAAPEIINAAESDVAVQVATAAVKVHVFV